MIIECVINKTNVVSKTYQEYVYEYVHLEEVCLEIGRKYVVYGIIFREGFPWYYICEENSDEYPKPHFFDFFKVINSKVSSNWEIHFYDEQKIITNILPSEWKNDDLFYENLINGNEKEIQKFKQIKKIIDGENII